METPIVAFAFELTDSQGGFMDDFEKMLGNKIAQ